MIKLRSLINLNKMVYSDKIKSKHQEKMDMETSIIPEVTIPQKPYPENASKQTLSELRWLLNYNEGVLDHKFIKEGDDVLDVFEKYCNENSLSFDRSYYKAILKESAKVVLNLKYYYNRPRPYQLAEFYGIKDFEIHKLDTANTPSYPSGHSAQGYLIGNILGNKNPNHFEEFINLGKFISESRLMARAHFPSDIRFGKKVGELIFNYIKGKV